MQAGAKGSLIIRLNIKWLRCLISRISPWAPEHPVKAVTDNLSQNALYAQCKYHYVENCMLIVGMTETSHCCSNQRTTTKHELLSNSQTVIFALLMGGHRKCLWLTMLKLLCSNSSTKLIELNVKDKVKKSIGEVKCQVKFTTIDLLKMLYSDTELELSSSFIWRH